jgi:hypothetical protein
MRAFALFCFRAFARVVTRRGKGSSLRFLFARRLGVERLGSVYAGMITGESCRTRSPRAVMQQGFERGVGDVDRCFGAGGVREVGMEGRWLRASLRASRWRCSRSFIFAPSRGGGKRGANGCYRAARPRGRASPVGGEFRKTLDGKLLCRVRRVAGIESWQPRSSGRMIGFTGFVVSVWFDTLSTGGLVCLSQRWWRCGL